MKRIVIIVCLAALSLSAQAQMVGATNRQNGGYSMGSNDPEYRPTGYNLHFEALVPFALGVSYQLNPNVMVGGGIAYYFLEKDYEGFYQSSYDGSVYTGRIMVEGALPIYVQARLSTPRYRWSVFADFKLGYNLGAVDHKMDSSVDLEEPCHIFFGMQAGVSYKRLSFGAGFGWNPARVKFLHAYGNYDYSSESYFCPSVSLSYDLPIAPILNALR